MANTRRDDELIRRVGERVRLRRTSLGLTQEDLSTRANIQPATLSRIENARSHPSLAMVAAVAAGLECKIGELADEVPPTLTGREISLLQAWRSLPNQLQEAAAMLLLSIGPDDETT